MNTSPHFRLLGVPIRVEWWFVLVALIAGAATRDGGRLIAFVAVVFVSFLVHELGHVVALRFAGTRGSVVIAGFVGLTYPDRPIVGRARAVVYCAAGPLFQAVLVGLPALAIRDSAWAAGSALRWGVAADAAFVSLWWAALNLLPLLPLDGGHLFQHLAGRQRALHVSIGVAGGLLVVFLVDGLPLMLPIVLLALSAFQLSQDSRGFGATTVLPPSPLGTVVDAGPRRSRPSSPRRTPGSRRSGPAGRPAAPRSGGGRRRSRHLEAVPDLDDLPSVPDDLSSMGLDLAPGVAEQAETIAWDRIRRNDPDGAQRALARHPDPARINPFLTASVATLASEGPGSVAEVADPAAVEAFVAAYRREPSGPASLVPAAVLGERPALTHAVVARLLAPGSTDGGADAREGAAWGPEAAAALQSHLHFVERFDLAAQVGAAVFADGRRSPAQAAFEVACSQSRLGDLDAALAWLERAIDAGFSAGSVIDAEDDLRAARSHPRYREVRARLG